MCNYKVDEWVEFDVNQYSEKDLVDLLKNCLKFDWMTASEQKELKMIDSGKKFKYNWKSLARQLGMVVLRGVRLEPAAIMRYRELNKNRLSKSKMAEQSK